MPTTGTPTTPPTVLSTTVQDPMVPGEPWVVTDTQREGETLMELIARHRANVSLVRAALKK